MAQRCGRQCVCVLKGGRLSPSTPPHATLMRLVCSLAGSFLGVCGCVGGWGGGVHVCVWGGGG